MIIVRYAITSGDFDPTIRVDRYPTGHTIKLDQDGRLHVTTEDDTWLATYHDDHWISAGTPGDNQPEPTAPGQQPPHNLPRNPRHTHDRRHPL